MKKTKRVRHKREPKKGILFTNPTVAAHIGAAAGSLLAAMYAENPKTFDGAGPVIEKYGRIHEREDVIAYIERAAKATNGHLLGRLVQSLRHGDHEGLGKAKVQVALNHELQLIKDLWASDFRAGVGEADWTVNFQRAVKNKRKS